MISDNKRRSQLIKKILKMPSDKLKELQDFANTLEKNTPKKRKILSYAGSWNDINNAAFKDLTDNLISRRQTNERRFEE